MLAGKQAPVLLHLVGAEQFRAQRRLIRRPVPARAPLAQ
jgi:hypothetical protein